MTTRLRVVDLTDTAAVYATRLLADMGADVARINAPGRGESPDASYRFFNAGKRSAAIDLRCDEGLDVLVRLCTAADAVVEGIEPVFDQTERVYERCRAANAGLIWVAVRPFAPGVHAGGPSTEITRYAQSGLMSITGMPGQTPYVIGGGLSDAVTATYAALACFLGYRMARTSGSGRLIYVSAHEALATLMQQGLYEAAFSGRVVKRGGNRHAHIAASGALACLDGYVVISANERRMWQILVETVGDERLRDPALNDERVRMQRQAEIFDVLEGWTRRFTKTELSEMAQARGIPVAPVHDVEDLLRDPQLRARGFFQHVAGDEIATLSVPWRQPTVAAPLPGQHTAVLLGEAGFSNEEIARLHADGVVQMAAASVQPSGARA